MEEKKKQSKKKTVIIGSGAAIIVAAVLYQVGRVIGKKDAVISNLENEVKNLQDQCRGDEETIRKLNYGLGKRLSRE